MDTKKQPELKLVETLDTQAQKDVRSVIDVLERALQEAKQGDVHACVICMAGPNPDGGAPKIGFISSETSRMGPALLAAVNLTQWRFCQNMWDENLHDIETDYYPDPPDAS